MSLVSSPGPYKFNMKKTDRVYRFSIISTSEGRSKYEIVID